jgi:2'-5' RNA ligase
MRLFTAIDIPAEVKLRLEALLNRLRPLAKLSWTPPANLHVTTTFIGEWPESDLDRINRALSSVPQPGPIDIAVRGLGWFPNGRNPRVFWAGIEAGAELSTLARDTSQALAAAGASIEDREYHPHLTLARRRNPIALDRLRAALSDHPPSDFGSFRAESFFLYLSSSGKYTRLHQFPLLSRSLTRS